MLSESEITVESLSSTPSVGLASVIVAFSKVFPAAVNVPLCVAKASYESFFLAFTVADLQ